MITLIASDLDGTLVNNQHYISKENVTAIKYAQDNGVEFIVSTGRSFDDCYQQVSAAGITCNYLVMNGSELRDAKGNILQTLYMNRELVKQVVEMLENENLYIEIYTTNGIFSTSSKELCKRATATKINFFFPEISLDKAYKDVEEHEQYKKIIKIDSLQHIWNSHLEVGKIISFSNNERQLARLRQELPKTLKVNSTGSFPINLEITDVNANKGQSLKKYAVSKGIELSEVMTIGDSFNDITMMSKQFGYTVAMGNAQTEIKKIAKYITDTNDNNGVGKIIRKYVKEMRREDE